MADGFDLHIIVRREEGVTTFAFGQCFTRHVGLSLRRQQAVRCIMNNLGRYGKASWRRAQDIVTLTTDGVFDWEELYEALTDQLLVIAYRPLTPRELLSLIPITKQERLRWTKDGRLPQSGSVQIRPGRPVTIATYAVSTAERLLADPEIIAQ